MLNKEIRNEFLEIYGNILKSDLCYTNLVIDLDFFYKKHINNNEISDLILRLVKESGINGDDFDEESIFLDYDDEEYEDMFNEIGIIYSKLLQYFFENLGSDEKDFYKVFEILSQYGNGAIDETDYHEGEPDFYLLFHALREMFSKMTEEQLILCLNKIIGSKELWDNFVGTEEDLIGSHEQRREMKNLHVRSNILIILYQYLAVNMFFPEEWKKEEPCKFIRLLKKHFNESEHVLADDQH